MSRTPAFAALLAAGIALLGLGSPSSAQNGCYCAQPVTGLLDVTPAGPNATDCLFILQVAVGLDACESVCICDVNASDGAPNATDALICLSAAAGIPDLLACSCPVAPCQQPVPCSEMEFRVLPESEIDVGWTGDAHGAPLPSDASAILGVVQRCGKDGVACQLDSDCTGEGLCEPTCTCESDDTSLCELAGPVGAPKRCNVALHEPCEVDEDCGFQRSCETFAGPPLPLMLGTVPVCVTAYFEEGITGLVDPALGTGEISTRIRYRTSLGISLSQPCPHCGAASENPAVGGSYVCEGGPRNGEACVVGAVSSFWGGTSLDCPPELQLSVGIEYSIRLAGTTSTKTLNATIPCGGSLSVLHPSNGGAVCLDTFDECTSNADCLRCTDNVATICATNDDCSGVGECAAAPAQPIACGIYCHCGSCDGDHASPCNSDSDCETGETCVQVGGLNQQEQNNACSSLVCGTDVEEACCSEESATCATPTAQVGSCAEATFVRCQTNEDCAASGAGACIPTDQPCFGGRIERSGSASPLGSHCDSDPGLPSCTTNSDCDLGPCVAGTAAPTAVALLCLGANSSAAMNDAAGLAGPAALTLKTAVRIHRCGDANLGGTEECDDGNSVNGDGCDEICRVER